MPSCMRLLLNSPTWIGPSLSIPESGLQDVVGISPDVRGGRLGVRLLRSVLTLGALHLFRFGFAVGTAQVISTL